MQSLVIVLLPASTPWWKPPPQRLRRKDWTSRQSVTWFKVVTEENNSAGMWRHWSTLSLLPWYYQVGNIELVRIEWQTFFQKSFCVGHFKPFKCHWCNVKTFSTALFKKKKILAAILLACEVKYTWQQLCNKYSTIEHWTIYVDLFFYPIWLVYW